jgi:hypothetical protein
MKKPNGNAQEPRSANWTEEQEKAYWHEVNKKYEQQEGLSEETDNTNTERPIRNSSNNSEDRSEE